MKKAVKKKATTKPLKPLKPLTYTAWVENRISFLKAYFFLHAWRIMVVYRESDHDCPDAVFEIDVDSRYLNATVYVFPIAQKFWDDPSLRKLGEFLVHEFSHTLHDPLYDLALKQVAPAVREGLIEIVEQQTQKTSRIIAQGLPKAFYRREKI